VEQLNTILYVEDDLHVRTTAKLVLEVIGKFVVHECAGGAQAVQTAREIQPDLIVLDLMMPEQDGLEVLQALRGLPHMAAVPALFMTSRTAASDLQRYRAAGAIGVIPKPLVPMQLAAQLRRAWESRPRDAVAPSLN
jgi:CheY-like chemotaxis protein